MSTMPQAIEPHYSADGVVLYHGDCREVMQSFDANSVDALVTDPPYELAFMGRKWDSSGVAYDPAVWGEALRVLKPGGHLLGFGGTRTWHRLAVAIEDAGFDIRDSIAWMYGSGFPKSLNLKNDWQGWGTALKPAHEPIVVARKPLDGTVAENVLRHGTGALNIDGSRIGTDGGGTHCTNRDELGKCKGHDNAGRSTSGATVHGDNTTAGRWPANVILDESQAAELDRQSGDRAAGAFPKSGNVATGKHYEGGWGAVDNGERSNLDSGGASRFFYVPKANKKERPRDGDTAHPTVKPLALMRYLVNLVTPPGGIVLDPFAGSGTTLEAGLMEGFNVCGVEWTEEYLPLIMQRLSKPIDRGLW